MPDDVLSAEELWELLNKKKAEADKLAKAGWIDETAAAPKYEEVVASLKKAKKISFFDTKITYPVDTPFSAEEPVVEEEEEMIPAACRFFVPNQQAVDNGSELPETWLFNKAQNFHACTNPEFNKMGKVACEMVTAQSQCVVFADTEPHVVNQVVLTKKNRANIPGEIRRLSLIKSRYGLSMPIYQIIATDANADGVFDPEAEEILLHTIDGAEHKDKTVEVANALWNQSVDDFGEAYQKNSIPAKPEPASYLKELITV